MANIPGILKDKNGNILQPQTSFEKVIDAADSKSLKAWRTEVDAVVPSTAQKGYLDKAGQADGVLLLGSDGLISADKLPAILNKFKGSFADEASLPATGTEGDYAICNDTDTIWIWDAQAGGGTGDWVDTGKKGSVTSVNGKTGDVEITLTDLGITILATDINGLPDRVTAVETATAAAKTAADDAQADATQALTDAAAAQTAAEAAQTAADGAQTAAEAAQTAADGAQTAADDAQADATQALTDAAAASTAAATAQTEAEKVDFAVVENGAAAPATLRDGGIYFEKD